MSDSRVSLVLDTSAVVAYCRPDTAIHVGDVLLQVGEDSTRAAIPMACLVAACEAVADRGLLDVLVGHPATTVIADGELMWRDLAEMSGIVGRPDAASAALAAIDFEANLLTRQPLLYAGVRGDMVIEIPR